MAESRTTPTVVLLNGSNYPTWRIQCKMALMKEGLWRIVTIEEVAPTSSASGQSKFAARKTLLWLPLFCLSIYCSCTS